MIDLTQKELSQAIRLLGEEINRGAWLLDRNGIPCELPAAVEVKCTVTAHPGKLVVESLSASVVGASTTTASETVSQTQQGTTTSQQSGGNIDTTDYTHGEVD